MRYHNDYKFNRDNFEKSKATDGFKGWRKEQYRAQNGHCAWCYKEVAYQDMDVDHIMPLARGGNNDFDNLVLSCQSCNRDEGKKYNTSYNVPAYNKTLQKLSAQQKQDGFAPEKLYWKRPQWIGPNKYCHKFNDIVPEDVPITKRNVWEIESPIIRDHSLVQPNFDYYTGLAKNWANTNSDEIKQVVKWILIIGGCILGMMLIGEITSSSSQPKSSSTRTYCDEYCQEAKRAKAEAEEQRRIEAERREEYEEAERWRECKAAGGSDWECG